MDGFSMSNAKSLAEAGLSTSVEESTTETLLNMTESVCFSLTVHVLQNI